MRYFIGCKRIHACRAGLEFSYAQVGRDFATVFGQSAEALVWGVPFLIQPFSAVFYTVDVLPHWLQPIAKLLPSTHVFEGMRTALATGRVDMSTLLISFGLNAIYLLAGGAFFAWIFGQVRDKGYLSRLGME